jgi:hypothetical protein
MAIILDKMTKNLKHLLKFLRSAKILYIVIPVVLIGIAFILYSLIPLPNIDDGYLPDEVRKVSNNAPLRIHFSQPMNRQSVEANFSIQPRIKGQIKWADGKTLEFQPAEDFKIEDEYRVTIGSGAESSYFKTLGVDFNLRFVVSGPPLVKFISPYPYPDNVGRTIETAPVIADTTADKSKDDKTGFVEDVTPKSFPELILISPKQIITVMFDRPMRELTTIDESASNQSFPELDITPPVKGAYRWVGTTAFQFIPDEWTMGTTYTLKLPAGITSLDGGKTEKETVWQLATEEPKVISSIPSENDDTFSVNGKISLTFNQPIDLDYIKPGNNVLLYPSNDVDADKNLRKDGFFNTEVVYGKDEKGVTDKNTLVFNTEFPYQYNQTYKLVVQAGMQGSAFKLGNGYGNRFMTDDYILNFQTVKKPDIVSFKPANQDQSYDGTSVSIQFASPITADLIKGLYTLDPKPDKDPTVDVNQIVTDAGVTVWQADISYMFEPSKYYTFEFKGPFKDTYGNTSDKGFKTSFKTAPEKSYLGLMAPNNFGLFMDGIPPIYTIKTVNIKQADIEFCSMSENEFFDVNKTYNWYNYHCPQPIKKTIDINDKLNTSNLRQLDLSQMLNTEFKNGIYFFEVSSPQYLDYNKTPYRYFQTFFISDTNLALKKSGQDLLIWATDIKTGKPVSGMNLSIRSSGGLELQTGVTDSNGIYKVTKNLGDGINVIGTKTTGTENRWSVVSQDWSDGIEPWQFNLNGEWVEMNTPRMYLYTERPLYKPGDLVSYKGIYRIDKDAQLSIPTDKKVHLVLEDSQYNEVYSEDVKLLADGSFNGDFKLSDKARLGSYDLYAETLGSTNPQRFYHYFFVEEYKKPQFKVEILGSQVDYTAGDDVSLDVQANYYFGGAIQGGGVKWTVMREPYMFDRYKGDIFYSFGTWLGFNCFWESCNSETKVVSQGEDKLDQNGRLHLKLPPDTDAKPGQSYMYTLNTEITNKDGETVSSRETFIAHQGSYYIGISPKSYIVQPGDKLQVKVISVAHDATIVSGKNISLEIYLEKWNTVKKQGVDGAFYDESVRELTFVKKKSITTGADPVNAEFDIDKDMEGGSYVIQAKGSEGKNQIFSETNFYVSSPQFVNWGSSNNSRMDLVPDQPEYFVGGKARILVKSPFGSTEEPVKALVTYERGGIQHYEVIDIKSNSDTIEVPIDESMVPNVYVSVMVVKGVGKNFDAFVASLNQKSASDKKSSLESQIKQAEDELAQLKSSQDAESNRNKILISKKEIELAGLQDESLKVQSPQPNSGDTNAGNLDFSLIKPDFKLGITNLVVSQREHKIYIDLSTSKPSYLVGEPVEIEIHTRDYQNRPVPSMVSLAVVDESLLALKANTKPDPLDYFYSQRSLQVNTSTSLSIQNDMVNVDSQKGAKGGGGGQDTGVERARGNFKDTAYFNPTIQTDQGGYAKITFQPPDNLTSWEMWAVASSKEDNFGMAKESFVVKKPLAITSVLPLFAISGDQLTIGALIHNESGKDTQTTVDIQASGITIKGETKKSVFVRDGASERADWQVEIDPVGADSDSKIEFSVADGNGLEDKVQYSLPVKTFAFPEVVATNGTVDKETSEKIRIPNNIVPGMGGLDISVGGSLLAGFIKEFKALADYPYGCAEQITSQILPTLVVMHTAKHMKDVDLLSLLNINAKNSSQIIDDTLQKYSKFQRFDGGYGYWEGANDSNPILTSYILYAQFLAMDAGFTISDNSYKSAIQYLFGRLNDNDPVNKLSSNERAFVLWSLSEAGQEDTGMTLSLFEKRSELDLYAQALMLMNLKNLYNNGQKSVSPFIDKLKSEIVSKQISQDRTVHFEEANTEWSDMSTDRRTNAIIMMALNRDNPENPILPKMIGYFISNKDNGYFTNTQESAWTLMAMLEYADSQNILSANFSFSADMDGKKALDGKINTSNLEQIFEKHFDISELKSGDQVNNISFQKDGEGQMNYDMELKYYLPNEVIWPEEKGFHITRNYYEFDTAEKDKPATDIKSGQIYRGELSIIVPDNMHYVVAEERLPAGFEAINFDLDTTDTSLQQKLQDETKPKNGEYYWYDNPLWYFNHTEVRDDRVLLFADYLPRGVYNYSFLVRAGLPGKYHHLPASAYEMYFPEVFGRTGGEFVEVK